MRLGVVFAKVVLPVQTALQFELHLQAAEPVTVGNRLGVDAIVFLLGHQVSGVAIAGIVVHHLAVLPVLVSNLGHLTQVVEGNGNVGVQARDQHAQVLTQGHIGQHLGLGILVITGFLEQGNRVHSTPDGASAVDTVGLLDGEGGAGQGVQNVLDPVRVAAHGVGLVALFQAGHHTQLHGGVVGDVHVYVCADTKTVVVGIGVVAVIAGGLLVQGVVLHIVDSRKVTEIAVTATERKHGAMVVAVIPVNLIPPVYIRIGIRMRTGIEGIELILIVHGSQAIQGTGLVHFIGIGVSVGEFRSPENGGQTIMVLGRHLKGRSFTALGCNHNYAITALYTVESSRYGVLENRDGFNFLGRDIAQVAGNTVYQHQRAVAVKPQLGLILKAALPAGRRTAHTGPSLHLPRGSCQTRSCHRQYSRWP